MAVKILALDATQEEQRQIMAELEVLHKVRPLYNSAVGSNCGCSPVFYVECTNIERDNVIIADAKKVN